jgi:3-hydroxyisobutyrate dehydrogenase-like beta-hydroxyacid dehydrogenase
MGVETVAILSPGEMGHAIGRVLGARGCRVVTSLAGRSRRTAELAAAAGIEDVGSIDEVVRQADAVLSVTTSAAAPGVAASVAELHRRRERRLLFVECNALAPQTTRRICQPVEAAGAAVVDVGIVGGPPTLESSPRFYASGPSAEELLALRERGLDVRPIGPEIGQASGLKMCYAALTKGLSALGTELLLAAERMGLSEALFDELASSQAAQLKWLESSVPGMPPKARRWVSEMLEIAATLEGLGLSPGYHRAASELFAWVGQTELGQERPESRDRSRTLRQVVAGLAAAQPTPSAR